MGAWDHRRVYLPRANAMADAEVAAFLAAHPAGHLVTVASDGQPHATLLPVLLEEHEAGWRVVGHLARANEHWTRIAPSSPGLVVVTGADTFVSPGWYASKAEHGRVVPTWNYSEVQLRGAVTVLDEPDLVLDVVTRLTHRHESLRDRPWSVATRLVPASQTRDDVEHPVGVVVHGDRAAQLDLGVVPRRHDASVLGRAGVPPRGDVGVGTAHDDPDWVLEVVTRLTERHESGRELPWSVTDAPPKYVRGRLRAIVGIEVVVESVEGKAKLSQNRSDADREGAIAGMRAEGSGAALVVADEMERTLRG